MQKGKWLSEEALQIAVKRKEAKSKGEKGRYSHLSAEFQRIAKRDKKAFLSDQCKEIEENNRMGKTRDLFKKIRDTKGTFLAKMGSIKDRNGMGLTEAEDPDPLTAPLPPFPAVASDRVSIHSLGHMSPVLSPQNLLSCDTHNQQGCRGGRLDGAWWFLRRRG